MARIVIIGSIARDEVVQLAEPLRSGAHLNETTAGLRLGGGGANTAIALAAAGHQVTLLAAVGRHRSGDALLAELEAVGLDTSQVARLARATTRSLILVDPSGERTVVNVLVVAHLPPVDPGSRPAQVLVASASDLDPNAAEDPLALGRGVAGDTLRWMVITAGGAGARAVSEGEVLRAPAEQVQAVDTTGAGDAFAAGLIHALVSGREMRDALALAVRFGTEATRWRSSGLPAQAIRRLLQ